MAFEALEIKTIDRLKRSFSLGYNYDTSIIGARMLIRVSLNLVGSTQKHELWKSSSFRAFNRPKSTKGQSI